MRGNMMTSAQANHKRMSSELLYGILLPVIAMKFRTMLGTNLQLLQISILCLQVIGQTLDASCSTVVTVGFGGAASEDCSIVAESLENKTCSDLQDVLFNLEKGWTAPRDGDTGNITPCVEVQLLPGHYVLTRNFTIVGLSLTLVGKDGEAPVSVSFNLSGSFDPTTTHSPFYVLLISDSSTVEISGISFLESPGIIAVQNVETVQIERCTFRYFFQGAVDLYNCDFVIVQDSIFEHNGPASIVKREPFRGHSGGLSLGYYRINVSGGPRALVSNCTFRNNTSDPNSATVQSTSDLFQFFAFTGRGGGCAFTISPSTSLTAVVEDSIVEGNFARSFGGGLYVGFDGNLSHTVNVSRVQFTRNECPGAAGGLEIGFVQGADPHSINRIFVEDSEFVENRAGFGAGIYFFSPGPTGPDGRLSNFGRFRNCTFRGNVAREYGAAIGAITLLYFQDMVDLLPLEIESCTFIGNDDGGGGGVLSTAYLPLRFSGDCRFYQNRGRTLVVIGAYVEIRGGLHFVENNGASIDGGAMYITSLGQLELFRGANITFTGNTGVIGAAMIIDLVSVPPVYSRLLNNPLCTLIYEEPFQSPDEWEDVYVEFESNAAVVASSVYLNNLDLCSWTQPRTPWFQPSRTFRWNFVKFRNNNRNTAHGADAYNQEWSVQTSAVDVEITSKVTKAYPGEKFSVGIKALDELGRPTSDIIRISDIPDKENSGMYLFEPGAITINDIRLSAVNTSFLAPTTNVDYGSVRGVEIETLLGTTTFADAELESKRCPAGYILAESPLQSSHASCQCDTSNRDIIECRGLEILLRMGLWATEDAASGTPNTLVMYPCPPGYCRCIPFAEGKSIQCHVVFNNLNQDSQCNCGREGDLCGSCKDEKGVSALLSRCSTCSNVSSLLILLLLVLDLAVFVVLLVLHKPLPSWAYPCIFYIQVFPFLTEHFPASFDQIQPPLYYISSGLSFYFIYDFCLYSNMSPLVSYFLRYLPLFLAITTACIWYALTNRLTKKTVSWHGLWWIVLLMYTHLLHTSMSILNCPILPGSDSSQVPRWFVSGSIKCFTGSHAPLGLLAIFILSLCVAIIPLSLAYNMDWLKRPRILKSMFEPLATPFKPQYRWWASIEMSRRFILLLFTISLPQNEYLATAVLMIILALYGFVQPFRSRAANILEVVFSVDVLILLLLRETTTIEDEVGTSSIIDSVEISSGSSGDECKDEIKSITDFAWLLFPFYYFSILITCVVGIIWIILMIWLRVRTKKSENSYEVSTNESNTQTPVVTQSSTTVVVVSMEMSHETHNSISYTELSQNPAHNNQP